MVISMISPSLTSFRATNGRRVQRVIGFDAGRAFTLVEVLVVLAVVALLASLLLPSLGRSLEAGNQAKCVANLRSLGSAAQLYVADNDGALPTSAGMTDTPSFGWSGDWWMKQISPYLDESMRWRDNMGVGVSKTPFACPSGTPKGKWHGHYGMNSIAVPFARPRDPKKRLVSVASHSETLLFADALTVYINEEFVVRGESAAHGSLAFRHNNSANVVYLDGHVGSVTKDQCKDAAFRRTLMGQQ